MKRKYSLEFCVPFLLVFILLQVGWFIYKLVIMPDEGCHKELTLSVCTILVLLALLWIFTSKMSRQNKILEENNRKLSELDRMKTEFLANVSHELRTPLTVIMGYSELLEERLSKEEDETNLKFVQTVHRKSEDLLSLINDLIDFSRIESGKLELRLSLFTLEEVISETVEELATNVQKKGHNVQVNYGSTPLWLLADRGKIKQIAVNLLQNAIKYTPFNGHITVRTYMQGDMCCLEVEDDGVGIPEDEIKHIYQPFKQADSSYNKKYEGFGLGLAITKSLVQSHNGSIQVQSEPGKGSLFIVSLPREKNV
ncbi:ATP-binding protein [Aneurinibacillus aneurinilyticus]|uniref:histidine kinase n=1 Tax=Aneurinibacillus aneurinilyticus TaxID=1391 RepID=A0A848CNC2_ANEAE|nr:HAMP domain-containing histidine kinase [Aneurinibacillus aneurinilyticus]